MPQLVDVAVVDHGEAKPADEVGRGLVQVVFEEVDVQAVLVVVPGALLGQDAVEGDVAPAPQVQGGPDLWSYSKLGRNAGR